MQCMELYINGREAVGLPRFIWLRAVGSQQNISIVGLTIFCSSTNTLQHVMIVRLCKFCKFQIGSKVLYQDSGAKQRVSITKDFGGIIPGSDQSVYISVDIEVKDICTLSGCKMCCWCVIPKPLATFIHSFFAHSFGPFTTAAACCSTELHRIRTFKINIPRTARKNWHLSKAIDKALHP